MQHAIYAIASKAKTAPRFVANVISTLDVVITLSDITITGRISSIITFPTTITDLGKISETIILTTVTK